MTNPSQSAIMVVFFASLVGLATAATYASIVLMWAVVVTVKEYPLDILQFVGVFLTLGAYAALKAGKVQQDSHVYDGLNIVAGILLCVTAWYASQWGFVLLDVAWTVIALFTLVQRLIKKGR